MNRLFRSLTRTKISKNFFFTPRYYNSSQIDDPIEDMSMEVIDPDQIDEEALKKRIPKTYVFIEKSFAIPIDIPLFPFARFAVSLSENRAKVFHEFIKNILSESF